MSKLFNDFLLPQDKPHNPSSNGLLNLLLQSWALGRHQAHCPSVSSSPFPHQGFGPPSSLCLQSSCYLLLLLSTYLSLSVGKKKSTTLLGEVIFSPPPSGSNHIISLHVLIMPVSLFPALIPLPLHPHFCTYFLLSHNPISSMAVGVISVLFIFFIHKT